MDYRLPGLGQLSDRRVPKDHERLPIGDVTPRAMFRYMDSSIAQGHEVPRFNEQVAPVTQRCNNLDTIKLKSISDPMPSPHWYTPDRNLDRVYAKLSQLELEEVPPKKSHYMMPRRSPKRSRRKSYGINTYTKGFMHSISTGSVSERSPAHDFSFLSTSKNSSIPRHQQKIILPAMTINNKQLRTGEPSFIKRNLLRDSQGNQSSAPTHIPRLSRVKEQKSSDTGSLYSHNSRNQGNGRLSPASPPPSLPSLEKGSFQNDVIKRNRDEFRREAMAHKHKRSQLAQGVVEEVKRWEKEGDVLQKSRQPQVSWMKYSDAAADVSDELTSSSPEKNSAKCLPPAISDNPQPMEHSTTPSDEEYFSAEGEQDETHAHFMKLHQGRKDTVRNLTSKLKLADGHTRSRDSSAKKSEEELTTVLPPIKQGDNMVAQSSMQGSTAMHPGRAGGDTDADDESEHSMTKLQDRQRRFRKTHRNPTESDTEDSESVKDDRRRKRRKRQLKKLNPWQKSDRKLSDVNEDMNVELGGAQHATSTGGLKGRKESRRPHCHRRPSLRQGNSSGGKGSKLVRNTTSESIISRYIKDMTRRGQIAPSDPEDGDDELEEEDFDFLKLPLT